MQWVSGVIDLLRNEFRAPQERARGSAPERGFSNPQHLERMKLVEITMAGHSKPSLQLESPEGHQRGNG